MKKQKHLLLLVLLFGFFFANAQKEKGKTLEIYPYAGYNLPQSDFKNFAENGKDFGLALDYYLTPKFAFGVDVNRQINPFKFPTDFSKIPADVFNLTSNYNGDWTTTTFGAGFTYKMGRKRFTTSIYSKAGYSLISTPNALTKINFQSADINLFDLKQQEVKGFGITSGLRFNYKVNKWLSFFVNPQYVYSSAKINYSCRDIEPALFSDNGQEWFDIGTLIEQPEVEKTVSPSYFNLNAGLSFRFGGKKNKVEETNVNRNPSLCDISFKEVDCFASQVNLTFTSSWSNFTPADIVNIKVYRGATLYRSGTNITNNNQTLGAATGSFLHSFSVGNANIGSTIRVELEIIDVNNNLVCKKKLNFVVPPCPPNPCTFTIDSVVCVNGSYNIIVTSTWTNILSGMLNLRAYSGSSGNIPFTVLPNNLPLSISGSGSATHVINIASYTGMPLITIDMKIVDSNGVVICSGGKDITLPPCPTKCSLELDSATCVNGISNVSFTANWMNYSAGNHTLTVDLFDSSNNPIIMPIPQNGTLITPLPSGSRSFTVDLSTYAGTTIKIKTKICGSVIGGNIECCEREIDVYIPKCCVVCTDVSVVNTTNMSQNMNFSFDVTGTITVGNGHNIKKIVAQLVHITCNDDASLPVTEPTNFEILLVTLPSYIPFQRIGSIMGGRSNLYVKSFPPATSSANLYIGIGNLANKTINNYRVKLTVFKDDGTYCEVYLKN